MVSRYKREERGEEEGPTSHAPRIPIRRIARLENLQVLIIPRRRGAEQLAHELRVAVIPLHPQIRALDIPHPIVVVQDVVARHQLHVQAVDAGQMVCERSEVRLHREDRYVRHVSDRRADEGAARGRVCAA